VTGFRLPHGFAVAAGMVVAAGAGELAGVTERAPRAPWLECLPSWPAVAPPAGVSDAELLAATALDKKARAADALRCCAGGEVARPADGAWTFELPEPLLRQALAAARALARP
jgi:3-dehydroquinate synthetase